MQLCLQCILPNHCRWLTSQVCTKDELTPAFVRDLRAYAFALGLAPERWVAFLDDSYRDYAGEIVDHRGEVVELATGVFDAPNIRTWFRDFACKPLAANISPRLRTEAIPRITVMASILRAIDPVKASLWGKVAANDGAIVLPFASPAQAERDCPYPRMLCADEKRTG